MAYVASNLTHTPRLSKALLEFNGFGCFIFIALCFFCFSAKAETENRHALIIGNSNYGSGFSLVNPRNDSTAIADKLTSIGYNVHKGGALHDLEIDELNNEIDAFLGSVKDGSSTLIYYAGHGAASTGSNFLIPILPDGVRLRSESDIRNRSVSLESILERTRQHNPSGVNVLLIDACRDAPVDNFSRSINLTGLTSLDNRRQPQGSFIGFSTEYGKVALDGDGSGYSPFAAALLNNLDTRAAAPIELFYKGVSRDVYRATSGQQFPIQEPKIRGDYCLIPCDTSVATAGVESNNSLQEFGYLNVVTKPLGAKVCYLVEGEWDDWVCGQRMALPIGKPVSVKVSANSHKTYSTTTTIANTQQQLMVDLKPKSNRGYVIAGAVAAAVVTGILISSGGGSDSSGSSSQDEGYSLTLSPP